MMLALPKTGIKRSVSSHNSRLDTFCDWLEASLLFLGEELSTTDVIDLLMEQQFYSDQDFASEWVTNVWTELRRRHKILGDGASFSFPRHRRIRPTKEWRDSLAHSFCVILSCSHWYGFSVAENTHDYTEQGELFELLTKESLEYQFPDWVIHQTGWSRNNTAKLVDVVEEVVEKLGDAPGNLDRWADPNANEAGLDLLCYRPFVDERIGVPVYLMQCASGKHWKRKLHTPDLKIWTKVIDFAALPRKAFATPFAFLNEDFIKICNLVDGLLMDRYRILIDTEQEHEWLSDGLRTRLSGWLEPRIADLLAIQD